MSHFENILILYAEVMPYNVKAFDELIRLNNKLKLNVVCFEKDKKITSYEPPLNPNITYLQKSDPSFKFLKELYINLKPKMVLVSGRMNKNYLKISREIKNKGVLVVGMNDEQFLNNYKQMIQKIFSNFLYRRYFTHIMVPGFGGYKLSKYLGFSDNQILQPLYSADNILFNKCFVSRKSNNKSGILFIGRLNKVKWIDYLIECHNELFSTNQITDKLHIVGDGPLKKVLNLKLNGIINHGFITQKEIFKIMSEVKYFILPSLYEPWGVVMHEAACAGIPIVSSDKVGSRHEFIEDNKNGYTFKSGNYNSLKNVLIKMNSKTKNEILNMGNYSYKLSKKVSTKKWAKTINNLIN
tara:strand:+ start:1804 stop:2865 length:1062 start_codon:yes stop_codon:yes gene_type:complete